MIDHMALQVSDLKTSQHFYDNALAPIGYKRIMEEPQVFGEGGLVLGWGDSLKTDFWTRDGLKTEPILHIAFRADSRKQVDEFYKAALAAGGKDNDKPGLRKEYHENYYAAYVLDPDNHNIEAVCHESI